LATQIATVSKRRLLKLAGKLSIEEMRAVEHAIQLQLPDMCSPVRVPRRCVFRSDQWRYCDRERVARLAAVGAVVAVAALTH
jgi:hypothetical protein